MKHVPYEKQLETTDAQFTAHLNLPGPAGPAFAAARKTKNRAEQVRLIAAHFRTRATPKVFFYCHGAPWHETDAPGKVLDKANGLLNNLTTNSWPPHQQVSIAAKRGGMKKLDLEQALTEAQTSTSRNAFLTELTTAFALTGNPAYVRKAVEMLQAFVAKCPFNLEPLFYEDHDSYFGGRANFTLAVCYRAFRWVDFLYCGAIQVPGLVTDEEVFWLVKQLWFYAMQYYRLVGDGMRRDNHHLIDHGHTQFFFGMMFPEFDISRELVDYGAKVIRYHGGANILPDGGNVEHSAEYQYHITYHYLHPLGIAQANNFPLFTAKTLKAITKWAEFNANLAMPNGAIPPFGDSDGRSFHHFFGRLAAPVMTPRLAAMARAVNCEPGEAVVISAASVTREMAAWRAGQPPKIGLSPYYLNKHKRSTPDARQLPAVTSAQFPQGGYTVLREKWDASSDYLAQSHHSAELTGGHAHLDILSFVLFSQGKLLIGDPASWLYFDRRFFGHGGGKLKPGQENTGYHRGYSYGADSHNMFVRNYDFIRPIRGMGHFTTYGIDHAATCGLGLFQAGGPIELAEAWHDEYRPFRHRRLLVHVKGIGYACVEIMNSKPGRLSPFEYAQFYHLNFDVEISPKTPAPNAGVRISAGESAALLLPGQEAEARWSAWRDEYLEGVYALGRKPNGKNPWVLDLNRRVRGDVVFTNFMLTGGAQGLKTAPVARYLGPQPAGWQGWQTDGFSAHALALGRHGTLYLASCPYGKPLASKDLSTDGELAVVHVGVSGRVQSWALARGSYLQLRGRTLVKGKKAPWRAGS